MFVFGAAMFSGTSSGSASQEDAAWSIYERDRVAQQMRRGTFVLPAVSPFSPLARVGAIDTIDTARWDAYWGPFVDATADFDGTVFAADSRTGCADAAVRVLVTLPRVSPASSEPLRILLLTLAAKCGVVENCCCVNNSAELCFTTELAARSFWAVLCADAEGLLGPAGKDARFELLPRGAADPATAILVFGKGRLGGPDSDDSVVAKYAKHAEALFVSVFDATKVVPYNGSLFVYFEDVARAREAVHLLHRSFAQVFGLALTYTSDSLSQQCQPFDLVR